MLFIASSSPVKQNGEMEELALLEPDLATLISRGDSLVLQVQTLDMDWALQINATTAELRAGRSSLKASHEVCHTSHVRRFYFTIRFSSG